MSSFQPVLILAPMRGITTMHYRKAFVRHFRGLDIEMAPFIATVRADRINPVLLKDVLPENSSGLPLVPQLISNNAADFVQMARALRDLGYEEINWNLGCPFKPVRNKRRGAGLLPHPGLVDAFLAEACAGSPCRISVKVRLGVSKPAELMELIPVLNRHPLSEVIIHPRTAEQMYGGSVDLDAFEAAYAKIAHPVCYNGDIVSLAFFEAIRQRFPAISRFMLGRGLLSDPFLCEEIKAHITQSREDAKNTNLDSEDSAPLRLCAEKKEVSEYITRIAAFHRDLLASYEAAYHGDHSILGKMKEFWTYQAVHLSNGHDLFKKIKKTHHVATYRDIVAEFLPAAAWTA